MEARMNYVAAIRPEVLHAMQAFGKPDDRVDLKTMELCKVRASQINGCSVCLDGHWRILKKAGESDERIHAVAGWRDAPFYTPAERAALALTEAMTRIADREDAVPEAIWNEAKRHYDDGQLAVLMIGIAAINVWNRLNVATRQVAGAWKP